MIDAKTIDDLVDELDMVSDDTSSYFHPSTGEIFTVTEDMTSGLEDDFEEDDESCEAVELAQPDQSGQSIGWLAEVRAKLREIDGSNEWLHLPSKFDVHEWAIMRDFALSVENPELRERLMDAIHGKGAFRCFRDELRRAADSEEKWYAFKRAALKGIIIDWLDSHNIPIADSARPSRDSHQDD